jgi:RNA polymerase sigma-70 factor, ECF subfamily
MTAEQGDDAALAREFEALRPRLMRVAYATTGSLAEAEDCVQEAWLRLQRAERDTIRNLSAWLITAVSRLALDALDRERVRRKHHAGPWLPEPVVESLADPADPADRVTLDESVSMALLIVLEALTPAERIAFLLHDVFGLPFDDISGVVGRPATAVRQLASRARRRVREDRPHLTQTRTRQRDLLDAFTQACAEGDMERLVTLLDPDVVWRADGGAVRAEPRLARGASRIAGLIVVYARRPHLELRKVLVNGAPGLIVRDADGILSVLALTLDAGRVIAIDVVRDPEKLMRVEEALARARGE